MGVRIKTEIYFQCKNLTMGVRIKTNFRIKTEENSWFE